MDGSGLLDLSHERQVQVDAVLARFFSLAKNRAAAFGSQYVTLWETLENNTVGGKRFRPKMVMCAYQSLGGDDLEAAANVGAAFELLHTALIVHDDVIDHDFTRRGSPNIAGTYRDRAIATGASTRVANHSGISAAVIAGDLALFNSYRLIDRSGVSDQMRTRLLEVMDDALFASAAGELIDVDFQIAAEVPRVDDILTMERYKTAVYSFECPLQAGAILAGASEQVVSTLSDFGREIGIAYQIVDDLLGVFGLEEETGKTTTGDLREGKRTVLIAYATSTREWADAAHLFGDPDLTDEQAGVLRDVLIECGARSFAEGLARYYANRALARLAEPHIPPALRAELHPVADSVLGRVK
ncbi:geranylgeranyl pyrophosphate synthase [Salinibacterium xinjiangense]|uniref:Geranylgeranyl diphosphate synthase, type II n=1 Tax=Salinibacterium xinjiangense TaxID=386302 RepID=A0A2C8Z2E2_9MICO|nr:polyprenyl synthetase family protein [Salinibacterium xinjiangense]GGK94504.1 geranylgeranyl pyrophosphate synthase [Salinibacterium xinjiangense]SOE57779.1 geranylgeranyl diphosphate synthase, type II [Salinibacterium xinjiangense]